MPGQDPRRLQIPRQLVPRDIPLDAWGQPVVSLPLDPHEGPLAFDEAVGVCRPFKDERLRNSLAAAAIQQRQRLLLRRIIDDARRVLPPLTAAQDDGRCGSSMLAAMGLAERFVLHRPPGT